MTEYECKGINTATGNWRRLGKIEFAKSSREPSA